MRLIFVSYLCKYANLFLKKTNLKDINLEELLKHMKDLSDMHFPDMKKIHIVLDNFKTHNPAKFYEYLEPKIVRRLIEKFEFHFTPKHASWLNMAEIEFQYFLERH